MDPSVASLLATLLGRRSTRIHLVGVAGAGMSALARLLLARGYPVSGSDLRSSPAVEELVEEGLRFWVGHSESSLEGVELLCYSSAISTENPEREAATRRGIPQVRRAELLAALVREKKAVVVAGMHGKSTTAALLAFVFRHAGLDPSYYVGAEVPSLGASARWGSGDYVVIEGDESDGTLLCFDPFHAVVLNIEEEHLDYYRSLEEILRVFSQFGAKIAGKLVYCSDDPNAFLLYSSQVKAISAGLGERARYQARKVRLSEDRSAFEIVREGESLGDFELWLPGMQNVCNAVVAAALALEIGMEPETFREGLRLFRGARRRFEVCWQGQQFMVVDDYAHHPTEIRATLAAARLSRWPRTVALFQPHRYSRTKFLQDRFAEAFQDADLVFLTEVYAASEPVWEGVNGKNLARAVRDSGHPRVFFEPNLEALLRRVASHVRPGDLIVTLGAGDIHRLAGRLAQGLRLWESLLSSLPEGTRLQWYVSMASRLALGLGGWAEFWCEPASVAELVAVVQATRRAGLPILIAGSGTAMLPPDEGFQGVVVALRRGVFQELSWSSDRSVDVGAGVFVREVVQKAHERKLGGFGRLSRWPGSVGGLLASCQEKSLWKRVRRAWWVSAEGKFCQWEGEGLGNSPEGIQGIWVRAELVLEPVSADVLAVETQESGCSLLSDVPSAAKAVLAFEDLPGGSLDELLRELGWGGRRCGRVFLRPDRPTIVICEPGAKVSELQTLLEEVCRNVHRATGRKLVTRFCGPTVFS